MPGGFLNHMANIVRHKTFAFQRIGQRSHWLGVISHGYQLVAKRIDTRVRVVGRKVVREMGLVVRHWDAPGTLPNKHPDLKSDGVVVIHDQ